MGWKDVDKYLVAQDKEMWQSVVNTVLNVRVLKSARFLNYLKTKG
jgi:hypothetical protein